MTRGLAITLELLAALGFCWLGGRLYGFLFVRHQLDHELTVKDNAALAVSYGGYLLGLLILLSAPLSSPELFTGPLGLGGLVLWSILGWVLVTLALLVQERWLFEGTGIWRKVLQGRNMAGGILLAGTQVSNALIVRGALSDDGGLLPVVVFWVYVQFLCGIAMRVFLRFSRIHLKYELRRDNRAAALSYAGAAIAVGNLMGRSIDGPFLSWTDSFVATTEFALVSLAFLYLVYKIADWAFFPKVTIDEEVVNQDQPNTGVGFLVGVIYVGLSILIGAALS